jgi:hypothetical protein
MNFCLLDEYTTGISTGDENSFSVPLGRQCFQAFARSGPNSEKGSGRKIGSYSKDGGGM